jgi:hypothetical protein
MRDERHGEAWGSTCLEADRPHGPPFIDVPALLALCRPHIDALQIVPDHRSATGGQRSDVVNRRRGPAAARNHTLVMSCLPLRKKTLGREEFSRVGSDGTGIAISPCCSLRRGARDAGYDRTATLVAGVRPTGCTRSLSTVQPQKLGCMPLAKRSRCSRARRSACSRRSNLRRY